MNFILKAEPIKMESVEGEMNSGAIHILCSFDGNLRSCYLDTGSNRTMIENDSFSQSYPIVGEVTSHGASGTTVKSDKILINELKIGTITLNQVSISRIYKGTFKESNLIGSDILVEQSLYFDFKNKTIIPDSSIYENIQKHDLVILRGFLPSIQVNIVNNHILAAWDTGAELTAVNEEIVKANPKVFAFVNEISNGSDGTGSPVSMDLYKMSEISIGGFTIKDLYVISMNFSMVHKDVDPNLDFILGYNLYSTQNWYIDYLNKKWAIVSQ